MVLLAVVGNRGQREERPIGSYEDTVRTLEVELGRVEQAFRELTPEQWRTPTKLQPLDNAQPHWTVFELTGYFDISIGLTVMLMAEPRPGRSRPHQLLHLSPLRGRPGRLRLRLQDGGGQNP